MRFRVDEGLGTGQGGVDISLEAVGEAMRGLKRDRPGLREALRRAALGHARSDRLAVVCAEGTRLS